MIRVATIEDAKRLVEIYRYYVEKTAITFEYDIPPVEEFKKRIQNTLQKYPYYVLEEEGEIKGYAYAGPFATRRAFDWNCEVSIYIAHGESKKGYGKQLYQRLERTLAALGYQNIYACIATPEFEDDTLTYNSVNYHRHLGYQEVGEFKRSGYKFNRWYHIVWMEKQIGTFPEQLEQPKKFPVWIKEEGHVNI